MYARVYGNYLDSESDTLLPPELDSILAVRERDLLLSCEEADCTTNSLEREVGGGLNTGNSSSPVFAPCWVTVEFLLLLLPNNHRPVLLPLVDLFFFLFLEEEN